YDEYPGSFKRTVPYLLATLLYHLDWLRATLSSQHPLWLQLLFTSNLCVPRTRQSLV
ncbi:hypothetical protein B484DRAFT_299081, partial [Ochromonadaceae sp. CCMP2298]